MRVQQWMVIAALVAGTPALASAQGGTSTTGATTTTTTTTTTTADADTAQAQTVDTYGDDAPSHWTASGFIGSDFGDQVDGSHLGFGGSIGYMWRGAIGAEFLAGFAPQFEFSDNILPGGEEPQVNSYMANVMAAVPLGVDAQWQPFVSGGLGAVTLNSDFLSNSDNVDDNDFEQQFKPDSSQLGGNIGFGVLGYTGPWGLRADIRYFRAFDNTDVTLDDDQNPVGQAILTGLDFWRANIGVAFRW